MEICVPFADFSSLLPVPCLSRSLKRPALPRVSTKMAADQGQFSESFLQTNFQGYYECSACHVLVPVLENLLKHECAVHVSRRLKRGMKTLKSSFVIRHSQLKFLPL